MSKPELDANGIYGTFQENEDGSLVWSLPPTNDKASMCEMKCFERDGKWIVQVRDLTGEDKEIIPEKEFPTRTVAVMYFGNQVYSSSRYVLKMYKKFETVMGLLDPKPGGPLITVIGI